MSIRMRLAVWHSAVLAVSLVGFAVLVWLGTQSAVKRDMENWLARQGDGLEQFLLNETHGLGQAAVIEETREFSTGLPVGSGVELFDRNGKLLISRPESKSGRSSQITRQVTVAGEEFRFALWRSTAEAEIALDDLRFVLTLLIPVFLLISMAGGWLLSRRALRPVDDITEAARRMSLQDLSAQLPVPSHRDELQRLCQAWNEMLRRLDMSARRLQQFTADASHELRTPVALIRTTAELSLRQERSVLEYQTSLRRIQEDAQELTGTIESLMELAREDSGKHTFTYSPVDVSELLSEVLLLLTPIASKNNLEIAIEPSSEQSSEPLLVMGDRGALRRLLLVLLDNAMKFTPGPGSVKLKAGRAAEGVFIEVEDTGIGISSQELPRIFDRFYRADEARSGGGVGLGLSIAQWIVQGHNGNIEVRSSPGSGSVFRVVLPDFVATRNDGCPEVVA